MPSMFHRQNDSESRSTLEQALRRPETPPLYDRAESESESRFTVGRLGTQWRQRVGDVRMELNGNLSAFRSNNGSLRNSHLTNCYQEAAKHFSKEFLCSLSAG